MTGWIAACRPDAIVPDGVVRLDHAGRTLTICRTANDEVFCTDGLCPHEAVHLADGLVMDCEIGCHKHAGGFDYRTGEAVRMPPSA